MNALPSSMPLPPLVLNQLQFSKIGLGCATFGREINEQDSRAMMDYATDKGVNHFDLAAAYAKGESERIVGRWLAGRSTRPMIATKMLGPYTSTNVRESVDRSLTSLQVDAIDMFYFHKWDESATDPAVLGTLDALLREGKVRSLGVSNFTADQFSRVLRVQLDSGYAPFQALQNNNNYAVRHIDESYRAFCEKQNVAIFTFSPLGSGFLTGKHQGGVEKGSRFDLVPNNQNIYFTEESYRRLHQLEAVAREFGYSKVQLALSWALHQRGVASVLVGGRTISQIDQAFKALALDSPGLAAALNCP